MFCRNCGKQLEDGFKVCPYCGEPVSLAESDARRAVQEQTAAEDTQPVHNDIPKEPAPLPAPAPVQPKANKKPEQESESTGGWKVLGFFLGFFGPLLWFLPFVSLVLYLIWKSDKPKVANGIGQFTLIGLAVGVGLAVIIAIIVGVLFAITASMTVFEMIRSFFHGSLGGINDLVRSLPFID